MIAKLPTLFYLLVVLFLPAKIFTQIPLVVDPTLICPEFSIYAFGQFVNNCSPTGQIVFTVEGDYGSYVKYSIDNGATWSPQNQFSGLQQGYYNCKIKVDVNGQTCIKDYALNPVRVTYLDYETQYWDPITQEFVTNGKNLIDTVYVNPPLSCNGLGSIQVIKTGSPTGGEYSLNGTNFQSSNTFNNLPVGIYSVFIRKPGSTCIVQYRNQISIWPKGFVDNYSITSEYGCETGKIQIAATPSSGVEYSVNNGSNWYPSGLFEGLAPGIYVPKLKKLGCVLALPDNPFIIISNYKPQIFALLITPGPCDGNAQISFKMFINSPHKSLNDINQVSVSSDNINFTQVNNFPDVTLSVPQNATTVFIKIRYGQSPYKYCTYSFTLPSIQGTLPTPAASIQQPNCLKNNGTISFLPPDNRIYLYSINNGNTWQASNEFIGLSPGNYLLKYKRQNENCISESLNKTLVNENVPPQITSVNSTDITDCGLVNGTINIIGQMGTGNIEYSINNGVNFLSDPFFTNLIDGPYNIVIRNSNLSCPVDYQYNPRVINKPFPPTLNSVTTSNITDCSAANGVIFINATPGTGALLYSIDNGVSWHQNNSFNNLVPGNYTIKIKNQNGTCIQNYVHNPVILLSPLPPVINQVTFANTSDCGVNDGIISIAANPGSSAIQYSIDNGSTWSSINNFNNLNPGSYYIKIRNADMTCISSYINNPVIINGHTGPSISNVISTNVSDCGLIDGTISISAIAGESSLQFSINNGNSWSSTSHFNNLNEGNYEVKVRNSNGTCVIAYNLNPVNITKPSAPTFVHISKTDITDCNLSNGIIEVTASGSSGGVLYSFDNGNTWQSSNTISNLIAGNYYLVIKNTSGSCVTVYPGNPVVISEPLGPVFNMVTFENASNCDVSDGSISISGSSGSSPIEFSVDNGLNWKESGLFTNLSQGSYFIKIRNNNGTCVKNFPGNPVVIAAPLAPAIIGLLVSQPSNCISPIGSIIISYTQGSGPPQFTINGGLSWSDSPIFENLIPGSYVVGIRNPDGSCQSVNPVTVHIKNLLPPKINAVQVEDLIGCTHGASIISIFASGDSELSLLYSIDGGSSWFSNSNFENILQGNYEISVKYAEVDCQSSYDFNPVILSQIAPPVILNVDVTQPISCENLSTGVITINSSDPNNLIMEYSLNDGTTWALNSTFTNLSPGPYNVRIRNSLGCVAEYGEIILASALQPFITGLDIIEEPDCGNSNGVVKVNYVAHNDVEFSLNNGLNWQVDPIFTSVSGGNLNLLIRNKTGDCTNFFFNNPVFLNEKLDFQILNPLVQNPSNCDISDGSILIEMQGLGTFEYSIDNGISYSSNNFFQNLESGHYNIVVKESGSNCVAKLNEEIILISPEASFIKSVDIKSPGCGIELGSILCHTDQTDVQFSLNHSGIWQNSPLFNDLHEGVYLVHIRNSDGSCENIYQDAITLKSDASLNILSLIAQDNSDCSNSNGSITIYSNSMNTIFSIDNGATFHESNYFNNLSGGFYAVKIMDTISKCIVSYPLEVFINSTNGPLIISVNDNSKANCNNEPGYIEFNAVGNNLSYSIDGGKTWQLNSKFGNLSIGSYELAVREGACVTLGGSIVFETQHVLNLENYVISSPEECNSSNGNIMINTNDPEFCAFYSIDGGLTKQTSPDFQMLQPGIYQPVVYNLDLCEYILEPVLLFPSAIGIIEDVNVINPVDCIQEGGEVIIIGNPDPEVVYSLDGGNNWQESMNFANLKEGRYQLLLKNGTCIYLWPQSIYIETPDIPKIDTLESFSELNCKNGFGKIVIHSKNDNLIYSIDGGFNWQQDPVFANLLDGNYVVLLKNSITACISDSIRVDLNFSSPTYDSTDINIKNVTTCKPPNGSIIFRESENIVFSVDGGMSWQQDGVFSYLSAGYYNLSLKNSENGCILNYGEVAINLLDFDVTDVSLDHLPAYCRPNGQITIGGMNSGSKYSIDKGVTWSTNNKFINLQPGNYDLKIRTTKGCMIDGLKVQIEDVGIIPPPKITVVPPTCKGMENGFIALEVPENISENVLITWKDNSVGHIYENKAGIYDYVVSLDDCKYYGLESIPESSRDNIQWEVLEDTIICSNKGISYNFENSSLDFEWNLNNNLLSNSNVVEIKDTGVVDLILKDELGCIRKEQWKVGLSQIKSDYDFLISSEGIIGLPIIAADITWPTPDSVRWIFDTSEVSKFKIVENQLHMIYDHPGFYNVGIVTYLGDCAIKIEKNIQIFSVKDSLSFPVTSLGAESLISMVIKPNPNNGSFKLLFEYLEPVPGQLKIFDGNGKLVLELGLYPNFTIDEVAVNLLNRIKSGTYSLIYSNNQGQVIWKNMIVVN